jgi:hypothetical protein
VARQRAEDGGRLQARSAPVFALIRAESNFDPLAKSPKNAQGLMQLIPETAERFAVRDVWDPLENIRGGMSYLRWLLSHFKGDVVLALAGYNAGEGAVDRHKGVPPYPETLAYVQRIRALYPMDKHPFDPKAASPIRSAKIPPRPPQPASCNASSAKALMTRPCPGTLAALASGLAQAQLAPGGRDRPAGAGGGRLRSRDRPVFPNGQTGLPLFRHLLCDSRRPVRDLRARRPTAQPRQPGVVAVAIPSPGGHKIMSQGRRHQSGNDLASRTGQSPPTEPVEALQLNNTLPAEGTESC